MHEEDLIIDGEGHTLWCMIGRRLTASKGVEFAGKKILEKAQGVRLRILADDPRGALERAVEESERDLAYRKVPSRAPACAE